MVVWLGDEQGSRATDAGDADGTREMIHHVQIAEQELVLRAYSRDEENPHFAHGCDFCAETEDDGSVRRIRGQTRYTIPGENVDCCATCFRTYVSFEEELAARFQEVEALTAKREIKSANRALDAAFRLNARREVLGNRHPSTLSSIEKLASQLQAAYLQWRAVSGTHPSTLRNFDGAVALLREVLQARRETLGDRHPDTVRSIYLLGLLLHTHSRELEAQRKLEGAATLLGEALQGMRETLGTSHPDTLGAMTRLASLLKAMGDASGSEALNREVKREEERLWLAKQPR